jgi:hypothetical protein
MSGDLFLGAALSRRTKRDSPPLARVPSSATINCAEAPPLPCLVLAAYGFSRKPSMPTR